MGKAKEVKMALVRWRILGKNLEKFLGTSCTLCKKHGHYDNFCRNCPITGLDVCGEGGIIELDLCELKTRVSSLIQDVESVIKKLEGEEKRKH